MFHTFRTSKMSYMTHVVAEEKCNLLKVAKEESQQFFNTLNIDLYEQYG